MKKILMFTMAGCPYCRKARQWMNEVLEEHPEYKEIELEIVDEVVHRKRASQYDYYYVPTYYVGGEKLHEGAASKDIILGVFRAAFEG